MDSIHKVDCFLVELPDRPGELERVLLGLKETRVNLLACGGLPARDGSARVYFVPENTESFRRAMGNLGFRLGEPERAFLVQGGDRIGALADVLGKIAGKEINIVEMNAVSAGAGRWGMMLRVSAPDYERAAQAFGF